MRAILAAALLSFASIAVETPRAPAKAVKKKVRPKPKAPAAAAIEGEGPCEADGDCSVANGSTCCHCRTLEVRSRRHPRAREPECGCGDMSRSQMISQLTGESTGPCGKMPPEASEYAAACRSNRCVAVHR